MLGRLKLHELGILRMGILRVLNVGLLLMLGESDQYAGIAIMPLA